jgi:hypothetical protein
LPVGRYRKARVTVVYLAPRFATAIRMPDEINSVVLGDPASFTAEHSEREPKIVFVKPITEKAAQTNRLISTEPGYQARLLLISRGDAANPRPDVDFEMSYRPAGRFIVEPSAPSASIAQTVTLNAGVPEKSPAPLPLASSEAGPSGVDKPLFRTVSVGLGENAATAQRPDPALDFY